MEMTKKKERPIGQAQHRVSQVYQKGYGYRDQQGKWWISALDISKQEEMQAENRMRTVQLSIKKATVAHGEFDMFGMPDIEQSFLEDVFGKMESMYPAILKQIAETETMTDDYRARILEYMASLLVRSKRFRRLMQEIIDSPDGRAYVRKLCQWVESDKDKDNIANAAFLLAPEQRLNFVCGQMMHYLAMTLGTFEFRIIERPDEHGWDTCDDPVVVWTIDRPHTILSVETEVFFPLSRDYALHLCHPFAKHANNPLLRSLPHSVVTKGTEDIRHVFRTMTRIGADQHIFFSGNVEFDEPIELGEERA